MMQISELHDASSKPWIQLSSFTVLVFLLLTQNYSGLSQVVGPSQPVLATVGDDVLLPCRLEPAVDASDMSIEWSREGPDPTYVYMWSDRKEDESSKDADYKRRTSLLFSKLEFGDVSLKLSKVKLSDEGKYECFIPTLGKAATIDLVVGAVSFTVISLAGLGITSSSVELQCESAGWYPEPELLWLDADGNLLSAGPTETVRGPDDLYTVSSRVTVEKKHNNKFTCRVQQKNINQTRETWIHVPDDFFKVQSSNISTIVGLAVCLVVSIILFILAVVLFIHTRRQHRTKRRKDVQVKSEEGVELMSDNIMSMKTSEKKKQPESKQIKKEYDEIQNQLQQEKEERMKAENEVKILKNQLEKLKEEEVKQKEEQRMKEVEITKLKEKLNMKKTEVENKQTELQSLQKEKKKIQEDLKNLIKDLNTKITELKTITEELEKSSLKSHFLSKKKEDKKRMQTEIENLNKQLEIKNMEFQEKDEECEEKQVELKKLLDDQQKMETELIEEQQLMKKKYDDIKNQLQQEEEEKMKAENEVKILNSRLEVRLDEKKKLMQTEGNVKTLIQNMMKELDETDSQSWQQRHENMTVENQQEELQKKLKENKEQWAETEEKKKTELDQMEKENDDIKNQLHQEKEGRKKTENEMKILKNELEKLERMNSETNNQLQQEKEDKKKVENQVKTLKNDLEELKRNNSETINQLQQEKQKNETTENELKTTKNQVKELQSQHSLPPSDVPHPPPMVTHSCYSEENVGETNSDGGKSMTESITLVDFHEFGHYIRLKNISTEEIELRGWKLELQINYSKSVICAFTESLKLQAGEILCIQHPNWYSKPPNDVDLMWSGMNYWSPADKLPINLINNKGETFRLL